MREFEDKIIKIEDDFKIERNLKDYIYLRDQLIEKNEESETRLHNLLFLIENLSKGELLLLSLSNDRKLRHYGQLGLLQEKKLEELEQ